MSYMRVTSSSKKKTNSVVAGHVIRNGLVQIVAPFKETGKVTDALLAWTPWLFGVPIALRQSSCPATSAQSVGSKQKIVSIAR